MSDANRSARRKGLKGLIVEPYKQIKIGLIFLLVNLIFAALFLAVFGYYLNDVHSTLVAMTGNDQVQSGIIASKLQTPFIVGGVLMFGFILTTLLVSVRYTHHIYGPLVSIHRYLDDFADGKGQQSPLKLRDGDQLQTLAEKINKAIASIQKS